MSTRKEEDCELIQWGPEWTIDHPLIDEQHEVLVNLINEVIIAQSLKSDRTILADVIDSLISYTQIHFQMEEELMWMNEYPSEETISHKIKHRDFIRRIEEFQRKMMYTNENVCQELAIFLKNWLFAHIGHTDRNLVEFLKKKEDDEVHLKREKRENVDKMKDHGLFKNYI